MVRHYCYSSVSHYKSKVSQHLFVVSVNRKKIDCTQFDRTKTRTNPLPSQKIVEEKIQLGNLNTLNPRLISMVSMMAMHSLLKASYSFQREGGGDVDRNKRKRKTELYE